MGPATNPERRGAVLQTLLVHIFSFFLKIYPPPPPESRLFFGVDIRHECLPGPGGVFLGHKPRPPRIVAGPLYSPGSRTFFVLNHVLHSESCVACAHVLPYVIMC